MTSLRHPELRGRDILHLLALHSAKVTWEREEDASSEWVYFSFETSLHQEKALNWIRSKEISEESEVVIIQGDHDMVSATWTDLNGRLKDAFSEKHMIIVEKDFRWILEYDPIAIARFGRYTK